MPDVGCRTLPAEFCWGSSYIGIMELTMVIIGIRRSERETHVETAEPFASVLLGGILWSLYPRSKLAIYFLHRQHAYTLIYGNSCRKDPKESVAL